MLESVDFHSEEAFLPSADLAWKRLRLPGQLIKLLQRQSELGADKLFIEVSSEPRDEESINVITACFSHTIVVLMGKI